MSKGQSSFIVSSCSWLVTGSGRLSRAKRCGNVMVIGREGKAVAVECSVAPVSGVRTMYELFWDSGYGVFDAAHDLATHSGYVNVRLIARSLETGEPAIVEPFDGYSVSPSLADDDLRAAPHTAYLPRMMLEAAWQQRGIALTKGDRAEMPRPLLSQLQWVLGHRRNIAVERVSVDNKSFPSAAICESGPRSVGRLVAATQFTSCDALEVTVSMLQAKLVIDGLIARGR